MYTVLICTQSFSVCGSIHVGGAYMYLRGCCAELAYYSISEESMTFVCDSHKRSTTLMVTTACAWNVMDYSGKNDLPLSLTSTTLVHQTSVGL